MKRTLLAAALVALAGVAQAQVTFNNDMGLGVKNREFNPAPSVGLADFAGPVQLGTVTSAYGMITFTYLGQESGFTDALGLQIAPFTSLLETDVVGKSVTAAFGPGAVPFQFIDSNGGSAVNGGLWSGNNSIGLIATNFAVTNVPVGSLLTMSQTFDLVIGYNDSGLGHDDWDDFVVGVNFAPIPEPETYALMLAGLGVMGFVARRRRAS
jgi:hypothetical protein